MNVYISTSCLKDGKNVFSVLDTYKHHGITHVELGSSHTYAHRLDSLSSYNVHYLIHNYFPPSKDPFIINLASQDARIRKQSLNLAMGSVELCAKLNVPFYSIHPGYLQDPNEKYEFDPTAHITNYDKGYNTYCDSIRELTDFAEEKNVKVLVENNIVYTQEFGDVSTFTMLYTYQEFVNLFETIRSTNLGMLLDLAHLNVNAFRLHYDKYKFISHLKKYVAALHLSGNDGTIDSHANISKDSWMLDVIKNDFPTTIRIFEARNLTIEEILQNKRLLEEI